MSFGRITSAASTLLLVAAFAAAATPAPAAPLTVTKAADTADGTCDADCSLREAIREANDEAARPGPDVITFAADGLFELDRAGADANALNGDLDISSDVTI